MHTDVKVYYVCHGAEELTCILLKREQEQSWSRIAALVLQLHFISASSRAVLGKTPWRDVENDYQEDTSWAAVSFCNCAAAWSEVYNIFAERMTF